VPEHIGIEVDAVILFGKVEVETLSTGEEEKPGASWVSENHNRAHVRVRLHVQSLFGDVDVVRVQTAADQLPQAAQLTASDAPAEPASYEGETSKLHRDW
jgi:hypothetical protein